MPVKSSRDIYEIPNLVRTGSDTDGTAILAPALVKIKQSHAKILGIQALKLDATTLKKEVTRADGTKYFIYTNKGGFKVASYALLPLNSATTFDVEEVTGFDNNGQPIIEFKSVKEISIGLPGGISKTRFLDWLATVSNPAIFYYVRTPNGIKVPIPYTT